ncbi:MAG TPA: ATP-binding protein [Ilumatobacteraceae bacterium]
MDDPLPTDVTGKVDFERFFELAGDVLVVTRPDGYFEMVNTAFAELLGVSRQDILDNPWTAFVHPDDREGSVDENEAEFEAQRKTIRFENRYVDTSGHVHWLNWSAQLDPSSGLVYGTARDVTEQRAAREALVAAHAAAEAAREAAEEARASAEAASLAKSEFLSRMSHELRTPMNAILGFGQLLEMDSLQQRQHDSVGQILRAGRHLLGLIDEVLDITRIEIGAIVMSVEPVRVADTVADAVSLLGPMADQRGITLRSVDAVDTSLHVEADKQRLHQILVNYLSNAIKYTPRGSVGKVEVSRLGDGMLRIAVVDNGPGIAPDLIDRLFVPFDRLGAEQTSIEGTGLGLAHSKVLAERMGGRVGVRSRVGAGTTFWIDLPLSDYRPEPVRRPDRVAARSDDGAGGTIIYIDDNPSNTMLFERVLDLRPGVRVHSAMLGRQGLELAQSRRPNLIALDLHLPDISGETVLQELRADPATANIPIIILSADATQRQINHLLELGAAAYLTKPFDVTELLSIIDHNMAPTPV